MFLLSLLVQKAPLTRDDCFYEACSDYPEIREACKRVDAAACLLLDKEPPRDWTSRPFLCNLYRWRLAQVMEELGDLHRAGNALYRIYRDLRVNRAPDNPDDALLLFWAEHRAALVNWRLNGTERLGSTFRDKVNKWTHHLPLAIRSADVERANLAASLMEYAFTLSEFGDLDSSVVTMHDLLTIVINGLKHPEDCTSNHLRLWFMATMLVHLRPQPRSGLTELLRVVREGFATCMGQSTRWRND